jgi:WD40 repeat protein
MYVRKHTAVAIALAAVSLLGPACGTAQGDGAKSVDDRMEGLKPNAPEPIPPWLGESLPAGAVARLGNLRWVTGDSASARYLAYSPTGNLLATSSQDGSIKLWDARTGELTRVLWGDAGVPWRVAFSANGKLLLSSGRKARLWDVDTGRARLLEPKTLFVSTLVAFEPNGTVAVCAGGWDRECEIVRFSTETGRELSRCSFAADRVLGLAPTGDLLATVGLLGPPIRLWSTKSGEMIHSLSAPTSTGILSAFSANGKRFAVADDKQKTVYCWDTQSGDKVARIEVGVLQAHALALSADGSLLACRGAKNSLCLWNVVQQKQTHTLLGLSSWPSEVAFSQDGSSVSSLSCVHLINTWRLTGKGNEPPILGPSAPLARLLPFFGALP